MENAKIENQNATFLMIFKHCGQDLLLGQHLVKSLHLSSPWKIIFSREGHG